MERRPPALSTDVSDFNLGFSRQGRVSTGPWAVVGGTCGPPLGRLASSATLLSCPFSLRFVLPLGPGVVRALTDKGALKRRLSPGNVSLLASVSAPIFKFVEWPCLFHFIVILQEVVICEGEVQQIEIRRRHVHSPALQVSQ